MYALTAEGRLGVEPEFIIEARINSRTFKNGNDLRTENRLIKILAKSRPAQADDASLVDGNGPAD